MTNGAHASVCVPATVVFNTIVPRGFERAELENFLYADFAVGEFIREARRLPYFRDTLFVFVGDHGVHLQGHEIVPSEEYRVPALFLAPGRLAPGRIDTVTSQLDLAPTILGLVGGSFRSPFFGRDVRSGDEPEGFAPLIYKKSVYGVRRGDGDGGGDGVRAREGESARRTHRPSAGRAQPRDVERRFSREDEAVEDDAEDLVRGREEGGGDGLLPAARDEGGEVARCRRPHPAALQHRVHPVSLQRVRAAAPRGVRHDQSQLLRQPPGFTAHVHARVVGLRLAAGSGGHGRRAPIGLAVVWSPARVCLDTDAVRPERETAMTSSAERGRLARETRAAHDAAPDPRRLRPTGAQAVNWKVLSTLNCTTSRSATGGTSHGGESSRRC